MAKRPEGLISAHVPASSPDESNALHALATAIALQPSLAAAARALSAGLARILKVPAAVLSRDESSWRFEAEAFPEGALSIPSPSKALELTRTIEEQTGEAWTGIPIGTVAGRDWMLIIPGASASWGALPGLEEFVEEAAWSLDQVSRAEQEHYTSRLSRRVYAFSRRLARETHPDRVHALVLRTLAVQTGAQTAALATYSEGDEGLAIVATIGYPRSIVEHIRITPGEGIIGRAFATGSPLLVQTLESDAPRRLRYRTDSYMVLPIAAARRRLAVVTLTDRRDGRPFEKRDFMAARLLAAEAALALTRERLHASVAELTRVATVDAVTGLFNRRYFESRLEAEVQRARRQQQELALLMIDIDDFKRINDTRGHLEGDRALRDVADLLRGGVRIFDVCARFGGEEFVIVMPGATPQVAMHVAERIRRQVEQHAAHDSLPITVSIGVGMLSSHATVDDLVSAADRALIAAKTAGKNLVWLDRQTGER